MKMMFGQGGQGSQGSHGQKQKPKVKPKKRVVDVTL
jgi:hypothetical protein